MILDTNDISEYAENNKFAKANKDPGSYSTSWILSTNLCSF